MKQLLLKFNNLSHSYDNKVLYTDIKGQIIDGDKIGLIGTNGSGKSTLLKVLQGMIPPTSGDIVRESFQYGYIPQHLDEENIRNKANLSVVDFCLSFSEDLYIYYENIAKYERGEEVNIELYLSSINHFSDKGGYTVLNEVNKLLEISGFSGNKKELIFNTLSEGEKRLVYLVSTLSRKLDLIYMDEPTNHVDIELKEKYINLINDFPGAIVVVTHDRELLSKGCTKIWEIEDGSLETYPGNWELYCEEHEKRVKAKIENYKNNAKELERLEDLLERVYKGEANLIVSVAKGRVARQQKKLDSLSNHSEQRVIKGDLKLTKKYSQVMLQFKDVDISIKDRQILNDLSFEIKFQDKVALVGRNGLGKSTILKLALNECKYAKFSGDIKVGPSAKIGYISQVFKFDDPSITLFNYIQKKYMCDRNKVHSLLNRYLFDMLQINEPVGTLSGGEKTRIQFMDLLEGDYNFLILDEPTNHLDIHSINRLEELLAGYQGSVLFISHDQYFLNKVADRKINLNEFAA